jgi:hypothetical protein
MSFCSLRTGSGREETLISYAAKHGYETAAIGKLGPILIQDIPEANPTNELPGIPKTVIVDGSERYKPVDPTIEKATMDKAQRPTRTSPLR